MEEQHMARAILTHELGDPDFQWLLSSYTEQVETAIMVDSPCLPIVLLLLTPEEKTSVSTASALAAHAALAGEAPGESAGEGSKEPSSD